MPTTNRLYRACEAAVDLLTLSDRVSLVSGDFRYFSGSTDGDRAGVDVASSIVDFHRDLDFVRVAWLTRPGRVEGLPGDDDDEGASGFMRIDPLARLVERASSPTCRALIDPHGNFAGQDDPRLDGLVPFDLVSGDGDACVCFTRDGGRIVDELVLVEAGIFRCRVAPLGVGCGEYVERGAGLLFIHGWQAAAFLDDPDAAARAEHFLRQIRADAPL